MASQSSVVFKDDVLHLRSLERNLVKLAPAPKKKQKNKLPSDARASSDGDAPKESPNKKTSEDQS